MTDSGTRAARATQRVLAGWCVRWWGYCYRTKGHHNCNGYTGHGAVHVCDACGETMGVL